MAKACEVSRRTIFRDLEILRQVGVPLLYDDVQQRYRISGTYFLPPTNFTQEEALALIVLCDDVGSRAQLPFFEPARSAALKLASNLPDRLREHLRLASEAISIQLPPINRMDGQKPVYEQLLGAISERRCVRIAYVSYSEDSEISTRLQPYRLLFSRRSWYVIGRSSLHRDTRTFNLSRVRKLEVLNDHYQIPQGFCVDRYLRNAWHLIPEKGPDQEVVIRFSRLVAKNVAEVAWHKTQWLQFNPDGTLDYHVTVSGLNEISWWILGYGDQAEVLSPPELCRIVAGHARRLVERYGGGIEGGQ